MSRGLQITLVASILVLALGVSGLAAYIFLGPGLARSGAAQEPQVVVVEKKSTIDEKTAFLPMKNFLTDLADKDRLRYADVTIALALADDLGLAEAKRLEPQLRDLILGNIRQRFAGDLAGAEGKSKLAESLKQSLDEVLKEKLIQVYITDLVVQ